MSIPGKELSGAVTACRLGSMKSSGLDMKIDQTVFWSDSTMIIGSVEMCLSDVRRSLAPVWVSITNYVQKSKGAMLTGLNFADIASRDINADDREGLQIWLRHAKMSTPKVTRLSFLVQTTWQDSLSGNITNSMVSRCLPQHATILCNLRSEYGEEC